MPNRGILPCAALGILALTSIGDDARAQSCFRHPNRAFDSLTALPALIRGDLSAMSEKDGPFNGTDTIMPGVPITRFISAGQIGDLYFVWYELGGAFYTKALALYRIAAGGTIFERVPQRYYALEPEAVCQIIDDVADGKTPQS